VESRKKLSRACGEVDPVKIKQDVIMRESVCEGVWVGKREGERERMRERERRHTQREREREREIERGPQDSSQSSNTLLSHLHCFSLLLSSLEIFFHFVSLMAKNCSITQWLEKQTWA
jgi:hypothetical protein